jgi:hypothetical protein
MTTRAAERFSKFIEESIEDATQLPLIHTTSAFDFVEISDGDSIEPNHCKVFNKNLTYLFYGRPAYRTNGAMGLQLKFQWPFCFVIDPVQTSGLQAVYPFDTGAFALGLYEGFFSSRTMRDDFRLPGDLAYARRIVGRFYENTKGYLNGVPNKSEQLPLTQFEAQGVQALALFPQRAKYNPNSPERDERTTSIEIQVDQPINVKDATLALIVPEPWKIEPEFQEAITRWALQDRVHTYEIDVEGERSGWIGSLYEKVRTVYRDLRIFG